MSHEEDQNQDLKAFEAALAALRPRTDRLDGRWRSALAEAASHRSPLPLGEGQGEGCESSGRHQFVCIYCGKDAPMAGDVRRWACPTAFSTITAVAAVLLVMLVARSGPQVAVQEGGQDTARPSESKLDKGPVSGYGLAEASGSRRLSVAGAEGEFYLALRDQVLRDGVESWKFPVSPAMTAVTAERPLNCREQLDRLLKQQGLRGS
jgi:hypothetical protein